METGSFLIPPLHDALCLTSSIVHHKVRDFFTLVRSYVKVTLRAWRAAMTNDHSQLSPLARQLQDLVSQGVVTPSYMPVSSFPSAYVVVPVYDSGNASGAAPREFSTNHAQLARRP